MKKFFQYPRPIILALMALLLAGCAKDDHYVVMLSLDGFRWDYAEHIPTPNLDFIARNGVKAESLKPSFPSKTFPNHYTIVTGLYPDHHGIVNNCFYDPIADRNYKISDREAVGDGTFYEGEPLWVTAEKQQVKSASYFWVGSEADIQNIRPSYWKTYDGQFPLSKSIDTVIYWLQLPEEARPNLILFYSSEPDHVGHDFGPDDKRVKEKVVFLDSLVGVFLEKLKNIPIYKKVDFIVVSDHGMTNISEEKSVFLSDYISEDWFDQIEGYSPVFLLQPKQKFREQAYKALNDIEHIGFWARDSLPGRWNYGTNERVLDFVLVAENGWQIRENRNSKGMSGDHGYDNDFKDMHAIFYAMGPSFKKGFVHPTFQNIEIYNLICHILGLQPAPNDGRLENIRGLLRE